jgi:hypothetical protein
LIARWDQIHSALGAKIPPTIHHNGTKPAWISGLRHDAIGVLMPVHDDTDVTQRDPLPAWAVM